MTPAWMAQETETSRNWGSYESDLFNYHNQENPPFATHLATTAPVEGWTLPLPQIYTYTSEGRTYCKLSARSSAQVDVSISWSVRESHGKKVRIAHLALTPSEGDFLWEHELIKIIAGLGFGSHQEHFTMLSEERQRFDNFFMEALNQAMPWPDTGIGECPERKFIILNNGITEINLNGRICKIDEIDKSGKSRKKRVPKWTSYRRKVRCGILLGIFDFNRMSAVEADVTLNPIVEFPSEEMVYYASRGHLLRIMKRFKDEEENLQNLLISPYLVIPSAAICFNELLLQRASQDLPKKGIGFGSVSPVKRILSADFLTDIFQYESEKRLLNRIMVGRSLLQDRSKLLERSSLIQTKTTHFLEALQATTLAAIALLQVYGFFEDCPVRFWVIFGIVIIGFIWYSIHRLRQ